MICCPYSPALIHTYKISFVDFCCLCICTLSYHSMTSSTIGKLEADGTMHVTLCDFIESWEAMSATQKKSLTQRYEMGCDCKVSK